jgi:alkylation response protein AidB-like acyl-CoA dehydrogenase
VSADYAARYGLSAAEEAWRRKAQAFALEEVAPLSREADRAGRFPRALVPRMAALGLLGAPVDPAHGGGGAGALAAALVAEELGRVDGSVRLPRGPRGPRDADRRAVRHRRAAPHVAAAAALGRDDRLFRVIEPGAGSDAAAVATTVREDGDDVVLDGEKHWITNGGVAGVAIVFGTADAAAGRKGIERGSSPPRRRGSRRTPWKGTRSATARATTPGS